MNQKERLKLKPPNTNQKPIFSLLEDKIADGNDFSIIYEPSKETLSSERIWEKSIRTQYFHI
jgi:predicted phage tail protein